MDGPEGAWSCSQGRQALGWKCLKQSKPRRGDIDGQYRYDFAPSRLFFDLDHPFPAADAAGYTTKSLRGKYRHRLSKTQAKKWQVIFFKTSKLLWREIGKPFVNFFYHV
jgi:hypothetical protein